MDVVSFLYKKGTRNYREFILPKIVILLLVGISLYFLSLEWPFISIMKTNNGSFWWKKMEMANDDHKWCFFYFSFVIKIGQFLFNLLSILSPLQLEILDIIFGFKMLLHLKPPLVFLTFWKSAIKELIMWVDQSNN